MTGWKLKRAWSKVHDERERGHREIQQLRADLAVAKEALEDIATAAKAGWQTFIYETARDALAQLGGENG